MIKRLDKFLLRLYPLRWRARYGEEFEALLLTQPRSLRDSVDIVRSALREHLLPTQGGLMETHPTSGFILRQPSALIPPAMSLAALSIVLIHIALYGVTHEADEGTAAHLWQLLMAGQLPVLLYFAIRWLPRAPRQTLPVLALQAAAILAAFAPVYLLHL
ncbi:MAG TPA: hypothetical protein VN734_02245 [Acidobacteriaceae bacterium]|nr:hypothetical protein [Acidobacteriaceae bacterium]